MKTISKFLAMFLFAVFAFSLVSCSSDDENGSTAGALIVNGEACEVEGFVSPSSRGIYLEMYLAYYADLTLILPHTNIAELNIGDKLGANEFYVSAYSDYTAVGGSLLIIDKQAASLTVGFNDLILQGYGDTLYKINGAVTLYHSSYDDNGNILPFSGI
ncbi:MAG: hypothetical protein IJX41_06895 [Bacteroidaceae bacterium]|nr:hypothetical protein [Bacteroidaceae bacterium]